MNVNDIFKVKCIDINHDGNGVVKIDGFPVFIEGLIDGETGEIKIIKVNKDYAIGEVIKYIERSPYRVKPICNNFPLCGGCDLLHIDYKHQLEYKKKMAEQTLKRIGHIEDNKFVEIIGMEEPYYYRNKIQIPFRNISNKVQCGYYKRKSHYIIPLDKCYIQTSLSTEIVRFVKNILNEYKVLAYDEENNKGNIRHVLIRKTALNEYMLVLVTKEPKLLNEEIIQKIANRYKEIKCIIQNINTKNNNVILGDKSIELYGKDYLIENILDLKFKLSHKSFFQTNHIQTEKLYLKVLEYLKPKEDDVIIDAYCGVGTMSLLIANKCKYVYGIEIVKEAIQDANENKRINKISNVEFLLGKSEEEIQKLVNNKINAVVLDPPRKGCDNTLIQTLLLSNIKKIVYVSCDVATLSRDLSFLSEKYKIEKKALVDMFPNTVNVECVVSLERR